MGIEVRFFNLYFKCLGVMFIGVCDLCDLCVLDNRDVDIL